MYAIVETGGKQYRVKVGDVVEIEKLDAEAGDVVTFDKVLMVGEGESAKVGTPVVAGATVEAEVTEQFRGKKLIVFKFRRRKDFRRRKGHRQNLTRVEIKAING